MKTFFHTHVDRLCICVCHAGWPVPNSAIQHFQGHATSPRAALAEAGGRLRSPRLLHHPRSFPRRANQPGVLLKRKETKATTCGSHRWKCQLIATDAHVSSAAWRPPALFGLLPASHRHQGDARRDPRKAIFCPRLRPANSMPGCARPGPAAFPSGSRSRPRFLLRPCLGGIASPARPHETLRASFVRAGGRQRLTRQRPDWII